MCLRPDCISEHVAWISHGAPGASSIEGKSGPCLAYPRSVGKSNESSLQTVQCTVNEKECCYY